MKNQEVLIFLSPFTKRDATMEEKNDFLIDATFTACEYFDLGKVYDYTHIPRENVTGFIKEQIATLRPRWVVAEAHSATVLAKMKIPRRVLVNPRVDYSALNNVPDHVRQSTFGFFDKEHEADYNRFLSVYPHAAYYINTPVRLYDLKSLIENIVKEEAWG